MLAPNLDEPVRIPVVCQSMIEVAYIQLTIGNNRETASGLDYSVHISNALCKIKAANYRFYLFFVSSDDVVKCNTGTSRCKIYNR